MANPISSKDLFKGDIFAGQAKGAESLANSVRQLISALESLKTPIKQSAEESKKFTDSLNLKNIDTKKLIQLEKEYEKLKKGLSDTEKINKQLKKSQAELVEVTDEQTKSEKDLLKEKIKQQKANREQTKQLKALITLEDKLGKELKDQADVLENLEEITQLTGKTRDEQREISQALRTVVGGLSEDYEDQADAIERLNETIDRNDNKIKENADSYLKQKINIGNYADGVKDALSQTEFFNTGIGKLDQILNAVTGRLTKTAFGVASYENATEAGTKSTTRLGRANQFLSKTFRGVGKAISATGIGAIIVAIASFSSAISTNRKEALEFQIQISKISNTFKVLTTRLGVAFGAFRTFGSGVADVFIGLDAKINSFFSGISTGFEVFGLNARKAFENLNKLNPLSNSDEIESNIKAIDERIKDLQGSQEKFAEDTKKVSSGFDLIARSVKEFGKAFEGTTDSITETNKVTEELLRNQFDFEDQQRAINREIAETNRLREIAQALSDDDTDSLQNIIKFRQEAERLAERELSLRIQLAEKELEFTEKQLEIELKRANATGVSADEIRDLVRSDEKRFLASSQALEAQQEALIKITELEKERDLLSLENINKRVKAEQDLFEQNLDFLIDVAERNRTIIEEQIADTTKSIDVRASLFKKLETQLTQDLANQLNEFDDFAGDLAESVSQKIDAGLFSPEQIDGAKEQLKTLENLDLEFKFLDGELKLFNNEVELTEGSIIELNKRLQELGLGEIPVNRLLEVLRDGKDARKELDLLNKEVERLVNLTKNELTAEEIVSKESLDSIKELNNELQNVLSTDPKTKTGLENQLKEVERIQTEISNIEKEAQKDSVQNRIDAIDRELQLISEASEDAIALRTERNNLEADLLKQNVDFQISEAQRLADQELEAEKNKAERIKEIEQNTFDFIEELTSRQFEKRIEQINAEIEANKIKQDELRDLAALGSQNAEENLAFEKQRGRELELERQKNQEQQARTELFLALLKATSANIANGDEPQAAILKALSSGAVLQKAANVLPIPGFYEGTENLTKGDAVATRSKSKDPFLIWGHPGERIIDHKKNAELGNYSNEELVSIVKSFDKGMKLPQMTSVNNYSISMPNELTEEIRGLKSLFPRLASDLDKHTGIMTTAIKQGNKVTTNKRRTR